MQPDELRVCVTGGYPINAHASGYEAEAIVYGSGGVTWARFIRGGGYGTPSRKRAIVKARAEAWIESDDATREKTQATERTSRDTKRYRWGVWLP